MSRGQTSLAVKCPAVKRHWRSKVSPSNVTCGQVFLILVAGQKSRCQMSLRSNVPRSNVTGSQRSCGQMSLEVKCPAVKCPAVKRHLRSNVPRSNVSCGQMSHRPSVVKCPLWFDVITPLRGQMSLAVYCPVVKHPRSNVPWSDEIVVIGDPIHQRIFYASFLKNRMS